MGRRAAVAWVWLLACSSLWAQRADIYPEPTRAGADIKSALSQAAVEHKRVILDFGGNWCTDCVVLDRYFHEDNNKPLLESNYVLVHINVGHLNQNQDIAARYQIPLHKGVPALAVLDEKGTLLYSQRSGEFESMRHLQSTSVREFLLQWKIAGS